MAASNLLPPLVVPTRDVRRHLNAMLKRFAADKDEPPVFLGAYRRPQAVLVPYERWVEMVHTLEARGEKPSRGAQ